MSKSRWLGLVIGCLVFGTGATRAQAQDGAPTEAANPHGDRFAKTFAFGVSGGLGAPLGYGGLFVNVAPIKYLVLEVGGGTGGRFGPAVAEMVRVGIPDGRHMFSLGVGLSQNITTSGVRDKFPSASSDQVPGVSHFLNVEALWDIRFHRFFTRFGIGVATLLNANKYSGLCGLNNAQCAQEDTGFTPVSISQNKGTIAAYFHVDVGGFMGF